jgi:hypothetical protein
MIHHPGLFDAPNSAAPQFKCELRDTKYRHIDETIQRQMLAPMARILAPSQRVSFKGIVCDFKEIELLKQTMSPTLNCVPAFKWTFVEAMSLAKDVADAAVLHDDIKYVMTLYQTIALTLGVFAFILGDNQRHRRDFLKAFPEVAEACNLLVLETLVNAGCCAAKARDDRVLHEAGNGVQVSMKRIAAENENKSLRNIPPQLRRLCYNVILWKNLYCGADGYQATVGEVVEYLTGSDPHPHLVHDSEVLSRQPDQDAVVTHKHLSFDQCSAVQLPLPVTSYHKHLLQQERFKGWLDMDLLRSLPEGLKQQINKQQKQYGIKVTAFRGLLQ